MLIVPSWNCFRGPWICRKVFIYLFGNKAWLEEQSIVQDEGWRIYFWGAGPWISLSSHSEFQAWKNISGSRFSPGDSSAVAGMCLGVRGSQIQSQKFGVSCQGLIWRSFGVAQVFRNSVTAAIQVYLSLCASEPFLGPHPAAKVQTVNSGRPGHSHSWTFVLAWDGPSGIDEFPTFSFLSAATGMGANVYFKFQLPGSQLWILPGGILGLFSWGIEEEGAAGKGTIFWDLFSPRYTPSWGQSRYWHKGKITINTSWIQKFCSESQGF